MDNPGWHAQRRALKEQQASRYRHSSAGGEYYPAQEVEPMPMHSIGGAYRQPGSAQLPPETEQQITPEQLAHMSPVDRTKYYRVAHMDPALQFMCGPLLKYDTVVNYVWYGAALIVTADSGSSYSPPPILAYEWDPSLPPSPTVSENPTFDLGPHPADPHASTLPVITTDAHGNNINGKPQGPDARSVQVEGQEIHVHVDRRGSYTFWRFLLEIPLSDDEVKVTYHINKGQRMRFYVPGKNQNMRWAAHSCNGFSAGVNEEDFKGPGYQSGYDPLWVNLLEKHTEKPFHVMVGGGDQLYCDKLMHEPEMNQWLDLKQEDKKHFSLTKEISAAIDRFYFHHYCENFRRGAFARANCSIPMLNMCDDHDLIDGFGSYPDELQMAPVFREIGARGYFYYLLFQNFINANIDGTDGRPGQHIYKSLIIGNWGPYVRLPSHSFLSYLGPQCSILLLDCRAERTLEMVCSDTEYDNVFSRVSQLSPQVEHLIVQLGVPIAYPRMVFLESALGSRFNPLVVLAKAGRLGSLGLSSFANKFNADAELLDDLNDHWTARHHKRERNLLIKRWQKVSRTQHLRISFISGDVHCAAVGVFKTLTQKHKSEIPPEKDFRFMANIITSAIVNTPPPAGVLSMVSSLATKTHKTLHYDETDETMLPLFLTDTNGTQHKYKYVMGRRNWCQIDWDPHTRALTFDIRVEKDKGLGATISYATRVPAPLWPRESSTQ